jgi:hypothetical protein
MVMAEKFMDAAKSLTEPTTSPQKYYPKFCVDLDQFPGLAAEMDESVEIVLRGRVCGLTHNEYSHTMEVEVQAIQVPSHTNDAVGPMNEADKAMGKLKSGRQMGRY